MSPDPNRYAGPAEAAFLRESIAAEEVLRATLAARAARAAVALHDAQRVRAEAQDAETAAQEDYDAYTRALAESDARLLTKRGRVHPLRKLPAEVLSEIFLAYLEAEAALHPDGSDLQWHHLSLVPNTVAQVSRRWRCVALETPRLWRYISVNFLEDFDIMDNAWIAFQQLRISRSASIAARLLIRGPLPPDDDLESEFTAWTRAIWMPLFPLIKRCTAVRVVIRHTKVDLGDMGPLLQGDAPLLEELTVRLSPLDTEEPRYSESLASPSPVFRLNIRAPRLRSLELFGVLPAPLDARDAVVYPRPTQATIAMPPDFTADHARALLSRLPALTELSPGNAYSPPHAVSLAWFAHPAVRRLRVAPGAFFRPAGPDTFPRLDAAVLTHPHPRETLADVLGPAGVYNAVRSLQLAVSFCDAELVRALDVLPRLETAILVGAVLARGFVALESWVRVGREWRCPLLEELVLKEVSEAQPVGPDAILAWLRERNLSARGGAAHKAFRRFRIDWESLKPDAFPVDFEDAVTQCLNLS